MKLLIAILLVLLNTWTFSQNSFKAILKDQTTKERLVGATAYIKKLKKGTGADTAGVMFIEGIPNGEFEIVFALSGYESKEIEFKFPLQKQPIEVLLKNE